MTPESKPESKLESKQGDNNSLSPVNTPPPPLPAYGDTVIISKSHGSHARGQQGVVWGYSSRTGRARVRIRSGYFAHVLAENMAIIRTRGGNGDKNENGGE